MNRDIPLTPNANSVTSQLRSSQSSQEMLPTDSPPNGGVDHLGNGDPEPINEHPTSLKLQAAKVVSKHVQDTEASKTKVTGYLSADELMKKQEENLRERKQWFVGDNTQSIQSSSFQTAGSGYINSSDLATKSIGNSEGRNRDVASGYLDTSELLKRPGHLSGSSNPSQVTNSTYLSAATLLKSQGPNSPGISSQNQPVIDMTSSQESTPQARIVTQNQNSSSYIDPIQLLHSSGDSGANSITKANSPVQPVQKAGYLDPSQLVSNSEPNKNPELNNVQPLAGNSSAERTSPTNSHNDGYIDMSQNNQYVDMSRKNHSDTVKAIVEVNDHQSSGYLDLAHIMAKGEEVK